MIDVITALSTNLFRTLVIKKFMHIFFSSESVNKKKEHFFYFLFFIVTTGTYLAFHYPPANIAVNLIMTYIVAQIYKSEQKKKILVSILIYGINMACDVLAIYTFSNYIVGEGYNQVAAYITVLLISICEFIVEKLVIKKGEIFFAPPYWNILILIPIVSIITLLGLLMNNLNNQKILVLVSGGILFINMLIFYLYNALMTTYLKLEDNVIFERQINMYANQLEVLMQSEEKINALRHDMKHHLIELLIMADKDKRDEIIIYIQSMQMFMENKNEYSCSGNREVDSILNYMLNKAQKVLNKVDYKISIPKEMRLRSFDLNVILGNLLENATLAAKKSEDKWLSIFINYDKGMLFINIQNSYDKVLKQGNKYLTIKNETDKHGIGLQNVKRVVSSYCGSMEISDKDSIFDVKIMLYTLFMK